MRLAAEAGGAVTPEMLRAEISALESRIYRAMLLQGGVVIGAVVALQRVLG